MGFGNLINPNILADKKLKKVHQDEKRENNGKTEEAFVATTKPSKSSLVKTKKPVVSLSLLTFLKLCVIQGCQ